MARKRHTASTIYALSRHLEQNGCRTEVYIGSPLSHDDDPPAARTRMVCDVEAGRLDGLALVSLPFRIVAHANKGTPRHYLFPVIEARMDPERYAVMLGDLLLARLQGEPVADARPTLPFTLIDEEGAHVATVAPPPPPGSCCSEGTDSNAPPASQDESAHGVTQSRSHEVRHGNVAKKSTESICIV